QYGKPQRVHGLDWDSKSELFEELALGGQRRSLRRLVSFFDQASRQLPERSQRLGHFERLAALGASEQGRPQTAAQVHVRTFRRRVVGADHDRVDSSSIDGIVQKMLTARAIRVVCAIALTYQLEKSASLP